MTDSSVINLLAPKENFGLHAVLRQPNSHLKSSAKNMHIMGGHVNPRSFAEYSGHLMLTPKISGLLQGTLGI
jgi:hypothetical protein